MIPDVSYIPRARASISVCADDNPATRRLDARTPYWRIEKSYGYGDTAAPYPFPTSYAPKPLDAAALKPWILNARRKGSFVGYYTW